MGKKLKYQNGGVFTLLLRNYILFTAILVAVMVLLFAYVAYLGYRNVMKLDVTQINAYEPILKAGDYEKFPVARILGKNGFIAVLDENCRTVYNNGPFAVRLTASELRYIPEYELVENLLMTELPQSGGKLHYQFARESVMQNSVSHMEVYILDETYRLLYASGDFIRTDLTEKEFRLLAQRYFKDCHVNQYTFQSSEGKPYSLLLFQAQTGSSRAFMRIGRTISDGSTLFLVIYCTMIVCFILWLKRKITHPLQILCGQLNQFSIGTEILPGYHGPREFEAIFDSFASMSARLTDSEAARKKLAADRQAMLAGITHDLKTPVTVIDGYARALSDGVIPKEQQQKYLAAMTKKTEELSLLINTFHEYNKLEHPDYHLIQERTDICNYFRDYAAEKYAELEAAGFLPEIDIPETHLYCSIDRLQLKRVFDNIVGNALRHNPRGTPLCFSLRQKENDLILLLADNGLGIPEAIAEAVFSPFVMGEASRSGSGSGLGLSIARRIIRAHGGQLRLADRQPDYKTVFEITLPLLRES